MIKTASINTSEFSRNELELIFYNKPFDFSYSSMNKLITAPGVFYKEYILKQREDMDAKHLTRGKMIHYLLLDNGLFDEKYILAPDGIPSDNTKLIIEHIAEYARAFPPAGENKLSSYSDIILDQLKEINLHQKLVDDKKEPFKTGDEKRLEKIINPQSDAYFSFLLTKGNREIIDPEVLDKCTVAVDLIRNNKEISELLGLNIDPSDANFGVYNEVYLRIDTLYAFGLKGFLDNLVVDVKNKTVRINDLKTTSKSLTQFEGSVEFWNYWLQAGIYFKLAMDFLKDVIKDDWKVEFRFIVVDQYNHVYPFRVSDTTMRMWIVQTEEELVKADFHYTNKNYSLPYEFIAGEVVL